jgi:hypothetical protein
MSLNLPDLRLYTPRQTAEPTLSIRGFSDAAIEYGKGGLETVSAEISATRPLRHSHELKP